MFPNVPQTFSKRSPNARKHFKKCPKRALGVRGTHPNASKNKTVKCQKYQKKGSTAKAIAFRYRRYA